MRSVGTRLIAPIQFSASGELLKAGALFNDEMQRMPGGGRTGIRKGVYYFLTHAEANLHAETALAEHMARLANERAAAK